MFPGGAPHRSIRQASRMCLRGTPVCRIGLEYLPTSARICVAQARNAKGDKPGAYPPPSTPWRSLEDADPQSVKRTVISVRLGHPLLKAHQKRLVGELDAIVNRTGNL